MWSFLSVRACDDHMYHALCEVSTHMYSVSNVWDNIVNDCLGNRYYSGKGLEAVWMLHVFQWREML